MTAEIVAASVNGRKIAVMPLRVRWVLHVDVTVMRRAATRSRSASDIDEPLGKQRPVLKTFSENVDYTTPTEVKYHLIVLFAMKEEINIILKLIISIMFTSVGHVVMLITHMVVLKEYSIDMLITNKKSYLEFSNLKPLK